MAFSSLGTVTSEEAGVLDFGSEFASVFSTILPGKAAAGTAVNAWDLRCHSL